jgi:hypothetical protein
MIGRAAAFVPPVQLKPLCNRIVNTPNNMLQELDSVFETARLALKGKVPLNICNADRRGHRFRRAQRRVEVNCIVRSRCLGDAQPAGTGRTGKIHGRKPSTNGVFDGAVTYHLTQRAESGIGEEIIGKTSTALQFSESPLQSVMQTSASFDNFFSGAAFL